MIGSFTSNVAQDISTENARVVKVGDKIWEVTSWPETDLAADVGWDAGWLIMTLGMLKVMSVGLHAAFKRR